MNFLCVFWSVLLPAAQGKAGCSAPRLWSSVRSYNARMAHTFDICIRDAGIVGRTLPL